MAENSAKVANMARVLAIVHIIVGFLLICFGIADRVVEYFWTGDICFGIWTSSWVSYVCSLSNIYFFFMHKFEFESLSISMFKGNKKTDIQFSLLERF